MSPNPAARGLFAVVLVSAVVGLTGALGMPAATASDEPGLLRIAHLSPDTPPVDVAVSPLPGDGAPLTDPGPDVAAALGYGGVGEFADFPAGSYAVSLLPAGAARAAPPPLSVRVDVPPGGAVTVAVAGLFADLALQVLPEDLSPPPAGSARVRVLAAAAGAASLDVSLVGGPALADGLPFGAAGEPVAVPAGPVHLRVDDGRGPVDVPADLAPGSVSTVLVLDRPDGGLIVRVVLDAAGPAVVPTGGVEAGSGPGPSTRSGWPVAALALALAAVPNRRRLVVLTAAAVVAGLLPTAAAAAHTGAPRTAADPLPPVVLAADAPADQPGPTRLRVPSAGVDADLARIGLDAAGALVPPAEGGVAGWYAAGPAPGEPGPAVFAGHVDGPHGPAVFARLDEVRAGDPVLLDRADGTTLHYVVTRVGRYPKSAFPTPEVYGPTPGTELRLITCGGAFDPAGGRYLDNVVVHARPA